MLSVGDVAEVTGFADAHRLHSCAVISHGVRADGHTGAAEVGDQPFFRIHGAQRGARVGLGQFIEQRAGVADGAFDLPEGIAAMKFCRDVASYVSTVDLIQRSNFCQGV
jgi:hypothetical protein